MKFGKRKSNKWGSKVCLTQFLRRIFSIGLLEGDRDLKRFQDGIVAHWKVSLNINIENMRSLESENNKSSRSPLFQILTIS